MKVHARPDFDADKLLDWLYEMYRNAERQAEIYEGHPNNHSRIAASAVSAAIGATIYQVTGEYASVWATDERARQQEHSDA